MPGLSDPRGARLAKAIHRLAGVTCSHGEFSAVYCQPCKNAFLPIFEKHVEDEEKAAKDRRRQAQRQSDLEERQGELERRLDYLFAEGGPGAE
jgi:hypothetical protein